MAYRDRTAIILRNVLLIIPLALVGETWHNPDGFWHYVESFVIVACLVLRERITWKWFRGGE
jgi:hypothetical protein